MELIDVLTQLIGDSVNSMQFAEMYVATVTAVDPLEVKIDVNQAAIREELLYRTDAVIERKIPDLRHRHSLLSGNTGYALSDIQSYIDGKAVAQEDGYIILNHGLKTGDKVLLLAVQRGQKFIILSHLYTKEG